MHTQLPASCLHPAFAGLAPIWHQTACLLVFALCCASLQEFLCTFQVLHILNAQFMILCNKYVNPYPLADAVLCESQCRRDFTFGSEGEGLVSHLASYHQQP